MIHTPVCDLLRIRHPIVLGGMAGSTSVPLVAAVSNAGGLGTLGIARTPAEQIPKDIGAIRETTKGAFSVNFLLFLAREGAIEAALSARPPVFSAAWARADQGFAGALRPCAPGGQPSDVPGRHCAGGGAGGLRVR